MTIMTVGELLDRGWDFETRFIAYYTEIREHSANNDVRLLTYYLARHRRHQEEALAGLTSDMRRHLRKVELTFDVPFDIDADFALPACAPEAVTGDELIEIAIRHDRELVSFYRTILLQPLSDDVRGFLEALVRLEERDIMMLKKMLAMNYF